MCDMETTYAIIHTHTHTHTNLRLERLLLGHGGRLAGRWEDWQHDQTADPSSDVQFPAVCTGTGHLHVHVQIRVEGSKEVES